MPNQLVPSSCPTKATVCVVLLLSIVARGDPPATTGRAKHKSKPVPAAGAAENPVKYKEAKSASPAFSRHFVEVEVVLDNRVTLKKLRMLPHAPGGTVMLLPDGERVRAQLPAEAVGDLIESGARVQVKREFFLVTGGRPAGRPRPISLASIPPDGSVQGSNNTDYTIGFGDYTYSEIAILSAPDGAEVTSLDVSYTIVHPKAANLLVSVTDENYSHECYLPVGQRGPDGRVTDTVTGITSFPGEKANQIWTLWAEDLGTSGSRYIDSWWIKVYYTGCSGNASCSGASVTGTDETDYPIPLHDWTFSEINVTGAPAGSYVSCLDVHYEIKHPYVGDVVVDLSNEDISREYRLWDRSGKRQDDLNETVTGIRAFANENPNQAWTLWAMDESSGDSGYLDRWWIKVYYQSSRVRPSHDSCSNAIPLAAGVAYHGNTAGATGLEESLCGWGDSLDVWHVYRPEQSGLVTFTLGCADFDATLSVLDRCGGNELACTDDTCGSTNPEITMPVNAGEDYLLRVAGYDGEVGNYTLRADQAPFVPPEEPALPSPSHEAAGVKTHVTLSWNGAVPFTPSFEAAPPETITVQSIYGADNRRDEYQVTDPALLAAGDATVVLMDCSTLTPNADGTYSLPTETLAQEHERNDPEGDALCPDEPFRDQPSPGWCSGVLVAPDLIATAGHCPACEAPGSIAAVFGFVMHDELTPAVRLAADDVYRCVEVVALQNGVPDWSLVRLDRPVVNRLPLRLRRRGKVADNQPLVVIGYPNGIPRKYDWGATVRENAALADFQANCDTYGGSSGAVVLNRDTLEIEGLLVRGNPDYTFDEQAGCDRSSVYPDTGYEDWENCPFTGCPSWEDVTRATIFSAAVPGFDVYLGTSPQQLQLRDRDVVVPWLAVESLQPATVYYWRVVARNACGEKMGPVWSFTTGP